MNDSMLMRGMICAGLLWAAVAGKAEGNSDLLAQVHFAGTVALNRESNAVKFKAIADLPASKTFREQIMQKLSRAPQELYRLRLPKSQPDSSSLFRPLWEDLLSHESFVDVHGQAAPPEWTLSVRLQEDRAQLWSTNLWRVMEAWNAGKPVALSTGGLAGWEVKKHHAPNLLRFVRAGDWCVIGLGQDRLPNIDATVKAIRAGGAPNALPKGTWLTVRLDSTLLAHWWRPRLIAAWPAKDLPTIELAYSSQGDSVRTKGNFIFAQNHNWQIGPWHIPLATIRDPLVSFTAIQGIQSLWANWSWSTAFHLQNPPEQVFMWGQATAPVLTYAAVPIPHGAGSMKKIAESLPPLIISSLGTNRIGKFVFQTNRNELDWNGWPLLRPFVRTATEANREYLMAGLFPTLPLTNPPPQELIGQVAGRTNLVYYDWEVTQDRLSQVMVILPLANAVLGPSVLDLDFGTERTNACIQTWLKAIGPQLGNSITEVTVRSPHEWEVVRKSHLGFTSLELVFLTNWLDAPQFPLFGYAFPARKE